VGGPSLTGYAKSGDLSIAYQVIGDGPLDVVFVPGFVTHLDIGWELEPFLKTLTRLSSFTRVIVFDKRGTGLSDRTAGIPTLAERMDDIRAVMDAAGSERAAIVGLSEGGPSAILFAATFPERTSALVLWLTAARPPLEERDEATQNLNTWIDEYIGERWGDGTSMRWLISGCPADTSTNELLERFERNAATPTSAQTVFRRSTSSDARPFLSSIGAPTLLIAHTGDPVMPIDAVRLTAAQLPDARLIEIPIAAHVNWDTDSSPDLDFIEEFLTGTRQMHEPDRVLATVLYTDIVGSTERAAEMGDERWHRLLDAHDAAVRRQLLRHRGREVNTTGDGFLAAFDGAARAIQCALAIIADAKSLGIDVRAGLHTGECEVRGADLAGIAVHVGARVAARAGAGEVLVSRTVCDLVSGSDIEFTDLGEHVLKGVPGPWQLFAVRAVEA
jgi:class 3 adenylate cyclase